MKKKIIVFLILIFLIALSFFIVKNNINYNVIFTLNGEDSITLSLNGEYVELGCNVLVENIDKTDEIKIDYSNLVTDKIGTYKIKYYLVYKKKEYSYYRNITIIDDIKPVLTLNGNNEITVLVGEEYQDSGATAIDNYDGDITTKIEVDNQVDTSKEGEYIITYKVKDSSNNESSIERKIIVKKPNVIVYENVSENKEVVEEIKPTNYDNTITSNKFTNNGFDISGYFNNNTGNIKLILKGDNTYEFNLEDNGNNNYTGNIDLTNIPNGNYNLFISSNELEKELLNKMSFITKIKRAKINDKLVTFNYSDDKVSINIETFSYLYDILIDPGHGGIDSGATNKYISEKEMNLTVSMYEKCRYEQHGLSVYMTRTGDTYGSGMGDSSLSKLHRRAYEIGYIGVVSKIVYSNHHNSSASSSLSGYEILLPANTTDLDTELSIVNKFNSLYNLQENHKRFYAKDYDTEVAYSRLNKEVYNFKDNYAVNRISYQVFNTKAIIYEGIYMSNYTDFNWYWNESNWIKVSEIKIAEYVKSLGLTYNSDNSSCL